MYRRDSELAVSLRTRERQGDASVRWTNGAAPYCTGVANPAHPSAAYTSQYTVTDTTYTYTGPGASRDANGAFRSYPRRSCVYLDEGDAVPLEESDRSFFLTESRVTPQIWAVSNPPCTTRPCTPCSTPNLTTPGCSYGPAYSESNPAVTIRSYVPDIEFFTINVDHSFVAPQAAISKNANVMSGTLIDSRGQPMSACIGYTSLGLPCPPVVGVGIAGQPDIIPLRSLLLAAGIETLDQVSGSDTVGGPQTSSMREQGLVLLLEISYTNYAIGNIPSPEPNGPLLGGTSIFNVFNQDIVQYTYRVFTVPNTQFQFQGSARDLPPNSNPNQASENRFFNRQFGVRLLVTAGGRVGSFFFQTLLLNIVAGLALLGLSGLVLDFLAFSWCPLRGLFKQLRERDTVSISQLRRAGRAAPEEYKALIRCVWLESVARCPNLPPPQNTHMPHNTRTCRSSYNSAKSHLIHEHPTEVLRVLEGGAKGGAIEMGVVKQQNVMHEAAAASGAGGAVAEWAASKK